MTDPALARHPETGDPIRRVIVGGYGVLRKVQTTQALRYLNRQSKRYT
jgi:hypothetical protein